MLRRLAIVAAALVGGTACSTTHGIRPVGKGAVSIDASLGGPITEVFGAPIPLPLTTVGATVGVTETTDVHASIHPTGAALFNVFAGDFGASQQVLKNEGARPRLMGDLTTTIAGGDRDADRGKKGGVTVFIQPSFTASWDWGKSRQHSIYTGLTAFLQPAEEFHALGGIYLGNRFGMRRSHLDIELKWLQPWSDNTPIVPEFYAPGNLGSVALQFGYGFTFGGNPAAAAPLAPAPVSAPPATPAPPSPPPVVTP